MKIREDRVRGTTIRNVRVLLVAIVAIIGTALVTPAPLSAGDGEAPPGTCLATFRSCCKCFSGVGGTCQGNVTAGHNFCETSDGEVFCGVSGATCYIRSGEV